MDGHQLPQRVLVHIFADAPNNVTLSPVVIPRCDGSANLLLAHTCRKPTSHRPRSQHPVHGPLATFAASRAEATCRDQAAWRRMWLEFGVHVGGTITHTGNWKLKNCPKDSGLVHGFDTFTGLPEDWGPGYQKVMLLSSQKT